MAGNQSIGKLNVVISGKADEFESAVSRAEKRLAAFTTKVSKPITGLTAGLAGIGGLGALAGAGIFNPVAGLVNMFPGGQLAATTSGLGDMSEGLERTIDRYRTFRQATEKYNVSGSFFRSFQLALGPEAENAERLLTKFTKYLSGNPELTRGAQSTEDAFYKVRDAIAAAGSTAEKSRIIIAAFGAKSGLGASGALEPGKMEAGMLKVADLGLYDSRIADGVARVMKLRKDMKLRREAVDPYAFAFQAPIEQAKSEWQQGNPFKSLTYFLESKIRRLGAMTGFTSRDDLLNMVGAAPKGDEARKLFQDQTPEAKKAIEDLTRSVEDMGAAADVLANRHFERLREQMDKLGATSSQMASFNADIAEAQHRLAMSIVPKTLAQLEMHERTRGLPDWEKALRSNDEFGKAPLVHQNRLLQEARRVAAGDLAEANAPPLDKIQAAFRKLQKTGGAGATSGIGDLARQLLGGATVGGPTTLALRGSQEQAALMDQINQQQAQADWKPTIQDFRNVIAQMRAVQDRKAAQDEDFANKMAVLFGEGKPLVGPG